MELLRSISHAKPFSIHFNVYIGENCQAWEQCAIAEWSKALVVDTSPFVRKSSIPIFDPPKKNLFFIF